MSDEWKITHKLGVTHSFNPDGTVTRIDFRNGEETTITIEQASEEIKQIFGGEEWTSTQPTE